MKSAESVCGAVIDYCVSTGIHQPPCTCDLPAGHKKGHLTTPAGRQS